MVGANGWWTTASWPDFRSSGNLTPKVSRKVPCMCESAISLRSTAPWSASNASRSPEFRLAAVREAVQAEGLLEAFSMLAWL